jgi:transposase InsO family protein
MEEREAFLGEWARGEVSLAELCRRHDVSRKTAYKWQQRYEAEGTSGLADRSRAPHHQAQAVSEERRERIVAVRRAHTTWGPQKIHDYLRHNHPAEAWPAASTMGDLLQRRGLVIPRRQRRRTIPSESPLAHAEECNRVWTADYKGWFLVGNHERCDPLTYQDAFSRFALRIQDVARTDTQHTQAVTQTLFREYGLPDAIRTDNGAPFASPAPAGLSRLSMSWIRLGIRHERIEPGCPQQNGRHERMHLTLRQDTASPPAQTRHAQQRRFVSFLQCYNFERPHEALGGQTPGSLYVASTRALPARIPEVTYPDDYLVRRISGKGDMKVGGQRTFLSEVLATEWVGLRAVDDDLYEVYWSSVMLGWFDRRSHAFQAVRRPPRKHRTPPVC